MTGSEGLRAHALDKPFQPAIVLEFFKWNLLFQKSGEKNPEAKNLFLPNNITIPRLDGNIFLNDADLNASFFTNFPFRLRIVAEAVKFTQLIGDVCKSGRQINSGCRLV